VSGGSDRAPRRAVDLSGFGLLSDGTTFSLSIVDLSYDGCKVQTAQPLEPGITLKFSITGLGSALEAVVRWYANGRAGLQFLHEEEPRQEHPPRQYERIALKAQLALRRPGRQNYQARMFDLAPSGCKVEFVERPKEGEILWARFEGLEPVEAVVRWVDGFYGGLEFVRPFHPAVFDLLLRKLQAG
jgi:hypothetical protein